MKNYITSLIGLNISNNIFSFNSNSINPVEELKKSTINVPNTPGLYFVFVKGFFYEDLNHLIFSFKDDEYSLMYFGKAGGVTKEGKIIEQGLIKRINNVISNSKRGIKNMSRANYWELIMKENKIDNFIVIYVEVNEPSNVERDIYNYLKSGKLDYPYLNGKLGRPKKTLEKITNQKISLVENNKSLKKNSNSNQKPISNQNNCIEFTVKKNQRISDISNNPNFPTGKLTINIRDTKSNNVVYSKERKITIVGRTLQKYFISNDASGLPKWKVIQNEMKQNNIEEITVRVCPIN